MIRVGGAIKVRLVATDARGVSSGQVVIAIHVALRTLQRRMRASEREPGGRVIERCIAPSGCGVALLASRREV